MKKITVCIPSYIRQVKLSEKRKPVYYRFSEDDGMYKTKGNPKSNKMPLKFVDEKYLLQATGHGVVLPWMLKPEYRLGVLVGGKINRIIPFEEYDHNCLDLERRIAKNDKEFLALKLVVVKEDGQPLLANPKVAGTPKYQTIRGQDFYSSNIRHARIPLMYAIKHQFVQYVKDMPKIDFAPIIVRMTIFDTVQNTLAKGSTSPWDVGNRAYPYMKAMLDLLVTGHLGDDKPVIEPKLRDDDRLHVACEISAFHPVDGTLQTPSDDFNKLVPCANWLQFEFIEDTRPVASLLKHHLELEYPDIPVEDDNPF